ncbi:helix-turn-helix transcriptional regulator [Longispora fulva]|uniref:DNA-binding CsgD family transcriptional regulator n=1 Tax=Longispora fulva TaxID=619741 RepID=A0A8J7GCC4_9ACTN|nr:LuxR family transcriptional regulator [Longispora fulva]MBG6137943.1 DNA-binding CsgD family transcriptional regulator [Longispora fulva]
MTTTPFVGRDGVLATLRAATSAESWVVFVEGEAGAGTSRLLREWLGDSPDLTLTCPPLERPVPWAPFATVSDDVAAGLGGHTGSGTAPGRLGVMRRLRPLLAGLVVVEDAQWLDPDSRDLLRWVLARPPHPLRLVVTYRPEELAVPGAPLGPLTTPLPRTTVRLPPLTAADVARWDPNAAVLVTASGGVAGVIAELLRCGETPALAALVGARLARSRGPALATAHAAAVLHDPVPEETLAAVAGADGLLGALRAGILVEHPHHRYGYRSPLAAQAGYALVPGPVRRRMHLRAVAALRDSGVPAALARHSRLGGRPADWLRYAEEAAEGCLAAGDLEVAVGLLRDLLAERSGADLDLLRRMVADPRLPARARVELGADLGAVLIDRAGHEGEGRWVLDQALKETPGEPPLTARALAALGFPYLPPGDLAAHRDYLYRAARCADEDPAVRTAILANQATLLMAVGDPAAWPAAERLAVLADAPGRRQQVSRGLCNLADAATWLGHYRAAESFLHEGGRLAVGPYDTASGGTRFRLDWARGHWPGLADRAGAYVDAAEEPMWASEGNLVLGLLALARGDRHQAEARLHASGLGWASEAFVPVVAAAAGARIRLLHATDDVAGAARLAEEAVDRIRAKGIWTWGAELVPWAVAALTRAGRPADGLVAEFAAGIEGADAPIARAALAYCRGDFAAAEEAYGALPRPYEAALSAEAAARVRVTEATRRTPASTDPDRRAATQPGSPAVIRPGSAAPTLAEGLAELGAAAERFALLGAGWDAARCRHTLRVHGVVPVQRGGRPGYGRLLSPREREVAVLAAAGQTNREIADVLFLSPRTVEQHVAAAIRKLGVASRADLPPSP